MLWISAPILIPAVFVRLAGSDNWRSVGEQATRRKEEHKGSAFVETSSTLMDALSPYDNELVDGWMFAVLIDV